MRIDRITVHAALTLPTEPFANVRPGVELSATLDAMDDPTTCVVELQEQANMLVLEHAKRMQECSRPR